MEKNIRTASEMLKEVYNISDEAKKNIVSLMRENNITEIDFNKDKEGRTEEDEDWDEDFVIDYNVQVDCAGRHDEGWYNLTKVVLTDDDKLKMTAQGCYAEIEDEGVYPSVTTYIDILYRLEAMISKD